VVRLYWWLTLVALGPCLSLTIGCDVKEIANFVESHSETIQDLHEEINRREQPVGNANWNPPIARDGTSISIATFNIQVFGQSKLKKPQVMDVLARVVRRFDVIAIQEIRSKEDNVLSTFIEQINIPGYHYNFVIGERLGRTSSKEQYAFVYDASRIELVPSSVYTVPDLHDDLHREPLVGSFRTRQSSANAAFTFTLASIHTDPDEVELEVDSLDDVFIYIRTKHPQEDDVILLGDFNADANHLGQLGRLPNIAWAIPSSVSTNTHQTKSYDNIIFDRAATAEYLGKGGVLDLMTEYGLTLEQAVEVSDHLPVWAEFSAFEHGFTPRIATRPNQE